MALAVSSCPTPDEVVCIFLRLLLQRGGRFPQIVDSVYSAWQKPVLVSYREALVLLL